MDFWGRCVEGFDVGGLQEGICEVELTDANGCVSSDMFWVEAVGVPDVDLGPDLFGCAGDAFTLLAPLQANLSYQWGVQGRQVRFWFWMLRILARLSSVWKSRMTQVALPLMQSS